MSGLDPETRFRVDPRAWRSGLVDVHVHLGPSDSQELFYPELRGEEYLELAAAAGVERAFAFPPFREDGYRDANRRLLEWTARGDGAVAAFARLGGPTLPLTRPELWMVRRKLGMRLRRRPSDLGEPGELSAYAGVKLLPHLDGLPREEELEQIDSLRLPVVVHSGLHAPPRWIERVLLPRLRGTVILAHLGSFPREPALLADAIAIARRYPNVYLDTSGAWMSEYITRAAEAVPDKLLFGSDCPLTHPATAWLHVCSAVADDSTLELIGRANAARAGLLTASPAEPGSSPLPGPGPRSPSPPEPRHVPRPVAFLDRAAGGLIGGPAGGRHPLAQRISKHHLWGRLRSLGGPPEPQRPPGKLLALSFDLDYQADSDALPGLLELLEAAGARASMAAIGRLVEADPDPYRLAIASGHELVNHSLDHPDNPVLNPDREFWDLSDEEIVAQIGSAQSVFERLLGVRPRGFRTPHFKDSHRLTAALEQFPEIGYCSSVLASRSPTPFPYLPTLRPLAGELSYLYSSREPADNARIVQIPLTPCPEHRWSPFDTYHSIRRPAEPDGGVGLHGLDGLESAWLELLEGVERERFASVYFDPMDLMRDAETRTVFARMLALASERGWELTTLGEIERRWRPCLTGDS